MSILRDIINWVEKKPTFWQVAIDRLIRNNNLTETDILDIVEICMKDSSGLSQIQFKKVNFKDLREYAKNSTNQENIILSKIFNVENINALSKTNKLEFATSGLTLVYGDNGTGKSSYVSILKHICNTRGSKPTINSNLYEPTFVDNGKKAEVEYTIDKKNYKSVKFINDKISASTLKSVDVFDTSSANHYIEGKDEIAFIPQGLSIIEKFATYLQNIETKIDANRTSLVSNFDCSVLEVANDTTAKTFLDKLNQNTSFDKLLDELEKNFNWNATKVSKVKELTTKINKLRVTDPKKNLKDNKDKIQRFEILKTKFQTLENALTGKVLDELKLTLNNYITTEETLKQFSEKTFADLPIKGVGNNSWKLLWESARKFFNESVEREKFPETTEDSSCPLCFQNLGDEAKKRFANFEDFVKNDIQQAFDDAKTKHSVEIERLRNLKFSFKEQEPTTNELNELINDFSQTQQTYLKSLIDQRNYLLALFNSKTQVNTINSIKIENSPKTIIAEQINHLTEENKKLETLSIEDRLKPLMAELNQLNGEKKIFENKQKLRQEIDRLKKIDLLNQCIGKCNTRSVTTFSNELSTTYITQSLKKNFETELNNLGFKNIKIETETKGERGKQYHFLKIDEQNPSNIALKDVLSEGEHRCISLATFLSELSISEHNSAIIFDDPVSSLDHKWRNKISKRIVEESKNRQVIVFTHDITFMLLIQEHTKQLNSDLKISNLTRKKKETGIITENPPWDALKVNARIGMLKTAQQQLKKMETTETEETCKEKVKTLYGMLRETWERFCEEILLNGAIQRFGRTIQTKRLSKVVDLTRDDYTLLDFNVTKCSTYFTGHDTADLKEELPDSQEFLNDLKVLEDFAKKIRDRRN